MKPSSKPMAAAPTVFVVDDDPSMREAISRLIKSVGLNPETFSSAKEFLEYKREDVPACLVLDVRLKGQSGLELQQQLAAKFYIPCAAKYNSLFNCQRIYLHRCFYFSNCTMF